MAGEERIFSQWERMNFKADVHQIMAITVFRFSCYAFESDSFAYCF